MALCDWCMQTCMGILHYTSVCLLLSCIAQGVRVAVCMYSSRGEAGEGSGSVHVAVCMYSSRGEAGEGSGSVHVAVCMYSSRGEAGEGSGSVHVAVLCVWLCVRLCCGREKGMLKGEVK